MKTYIARCALALSLLLLFSATNPGAAFANPSGVQRDVWMSPIFTVTIALDANVPFSFETSNLVPAVAGGVADTVLHVQNGNDANGTFLGGNDDFLGLASRVELTVPTARNVTVVVRAYAADRRGTAMLTVKRAGVTVFTDANVTFAGRVAAVGALAAGTHVWTQEQFDGPNDAFVMVLSGGASNAINADDDDGVGFQSWVHIDQACASCSIVYGRFLHGAEGWSTIAWDGDTHTADADGDGLGDSFENFITTSTNDRDTDDDGLDDAAEAIGIDGSPPVKLFTWGADPKVKDAFVEHDWAPCPAGTCADFDFWKMQASEASATVAHFAPDVRMHLDIGRSNPAMSKDEWTKWGDWGGASRVNFTAPCASLTGSRVGSFHHYHLTGTFNGGQTVSGTCGSGSNENRTIAHELGHSFGLRHGGNTGTGQFNNKPNYPSVINYGYQYNAAVSFSRNLSGVSINPSALNEQATGLSSALLQTLQGHPWNFTANPGAGTIDWNRDSQLDTAVRAAPSWIWGSSSPEPSQPYVQLGFESGYSPAFARMTNPQRLYLFSRNPGGWVQYRYTSSLAGCSGNDGIGSCVTWDGPHVLPFSNNANGHIAAHRVVVGGQERLMVVYLSGTMLYFQVSTASGWSNPVQIGDSSGAKPELAPLGVGGTLRLFYTWYNALNSRDYDPVTNTWGVAKVEKDPSNAAIPVPYGLSLTLAHDVLWGPAWYAAMPNASAAIDLWTYSASSDRWSKLPFVWQGGQPQPMTDAAPSLAYVPFSTSDFTTGQFYLLFNPSWQSDPANLLRIMKSEGNGFTSAGSRRFQFRDPHISFFNEWSYASGSPELMYEAGLDTSLRAASSSSSGSLSFFPIADGAANVVLKDQNDYSVITGMLDCALGAGGCIPL